MIRFECAVTLQQGAFVLDVVENSSIEVLGLFGPSGSGKTSLLEAIAGLRTPTRGAIRVGDRTLYDSAAGTHLPAHQRRIGYVPQDAALFPHLDVRRNIGFGAPRHSPSAATLFASLVETLSLDGLLDRRVTGLSGGECQRVAIARALMTAPTLLLLDEPLAAVDRERRDRILPYLLRIRRELHVPLVYVTHDAQELLDIADRVLVIDGGKVVRSGPPATTLAPATAP